MVSVQGICELVDRFVTEQISAADFANSFTPLLSGAVKSTDEAVKSLAIAVHAYVSHYFHGFISEQEFRSSVASTCGLDSVYPVSVAMPMTSERIEAFSVDPEGHLLPA